MAYRDVLLAKGADPFFAERMGPVLDRVHNLGNKFVITSVFRDSKRQNELRERWDRGEQDGLRARPAMYSKHTLTKSDGTPAARAVDIGATEAILVTIANEAIQNGIVWGGTFIRKDTVHFQLG